jgi:hypothetical protein
MSKRNGDRARFQKDRKRKLFHRQQIQALKAGLGKKTDDSGAAVAATPTGAPPVATASGRHS